MSTQAQPKPNAERILREHRELRTLLDDLSLYTVEPRPGIGEMGYHTWGASLSRHLVELHDRLYRHFRTENESGFFDQLKKQKPRNAKVVDAILEEHPLFLAEIQSMVGDCLAYSGGNEPDDPRLRLRLKTLLDRLGDHEERESDLLQRLHGRDIGDVD
jgi:hypothetical protein